MADRNFYANTATLEAGVVRLTCNILTTTLGTVATTAGGKGIKSVVRNSAGDYTVTLSDRYNSLLAANVSLLGTASSGLPSANKASAVAAFTPSVGTAVPSIKVKCFIPATAAAAAVAIDVDDGWTVVLELVLKNSTL